jgi:hypothetical protein
LPRLHELGLYDVIKFKVYGSWVYSWEIAPNGKLIGYPMKEYSDDRIARQIFDEGQEYPEIYHHDFK